MSRFRLNSFLFLLLIFVTFTPFAFSSRDALHELVDERKIGSLDLVSKVVDSVGDNSSSNSTVLILAAKRTRRKDPIDGFNYYTGGWNLTNTHYVFSVGFTAIPLLLTAVIWFVVFGLFLILMWLWRCCCCCCRNKKKVGYSQAAYAISLGLLIVLTVGVIAGSIFLYTGQEKFHSSVINILKYILQEANYLVNSLKDIADSLAGAKDLGVGEVKLPDDLKANIENMHGMIGNITGKFSDVTSKSADKIHYLLDPMRIALISVNSVMLFLAFLGFLFSILGLQCFVSVLTVIAWLAVVGTFILSGMFLFIHNAVADTCVAMDDFLQNPTANSAIENILPRANEDIARAIENGTRGVTFVIVNSTNLAIVNIYNADLPPEAGPLYYNQSGPHMPILCSPFDLTLHDRQCEPGEVDFLKAPEVWKNYTCEVSASGNCITPGRLTPTGYSNLTRSLKISYALYHYGPFLADLVDSTYLKQTFNNISSNYCPGLQKYSEWTYSGFTAVSCSMLLSVILWLIFARERSHRKYTKKHAKKSIDGENPFAGGGNKW